MRPFSTTTKGQCREERCCCRRPLRARCVSPPPPVCDVEFERSHLWDPSVGEKRATFSTPPPFFYQREQQQQQQQPFFCERKKKSTTNFTRRPQTTTTLSRPRNHFELQREDDDHDDDNADLLLFSFFPSLPLVVVDVPLFVERRACE